MSGSWQPFASVPPGHDCSLGAHIIGHNDGHGVWSYPSGPSMGTHVPSSLQPCSSHNMGQCFSVGGQIVGQNDSHVLSSSPEYSMGMHVSGNLHPFVSFP